MSTIIAVDDSLEILKIIEKSLEGAYELHLYSSGEDLLNELDSIQPDLFLLDIQMPEMDGYEICSRLKELEKTKDIPVVFLSAKAGSNTRTLAYKLGAISYLEKPVEIIELRSLVASVIRQTSGRKESVLSVGNFELVVELKKGKDPSGQYSLTYAETIILKELMVNLESPVSRERLSSLFSKTENATSRNIDTHISTLRKKIKNSNLIISTVYGVGYSLNKIQELKAA